MYWLTRLQFQQGWAGDGLSLSQVMLLLHDLLIGKPFGNLVWAFWHGLWILRKCTWKFPELLRTRFQNWYLTLPCCTGVERHRPTQISGKGKHNSTLDANMARAQGEGESSPWASLQTTYTPSNNSLWSFVASLEQSSLLSWEPVPLSHGAAVQCGEFPSKDFKLDSWILSLALPLAHCQILVKLLNVFGLKCSF